MLRPRSPLPYSFGEARPSSTRPHSPSASHPGASHPVGNLDGSPPLPASLTCQLQGADRCPRPSSGGVCPPCWCPTPSCLGSSGPGPGGSLDPIDAGPAKPQEAALFCLPHDKAPPSLLREGRPAPPTPLGALVLPSPHDSTARGPSPRGWTAFPAGELSIHLPLPLEPPPSTSRAPWGCGKQGGGSPELGRAHIQPQEVGGGFRLGATTSQHLGELSGGHGLKVLDRPGAERAWICDRVFSGFSFSPFLEVSLP